MSSSTSTSLTLRALLKTAAGRLGLGAPGRSVGGLTAAAKAFFVAAAAGRERTLLVVPTDADVEQLTADARFFLSALEGVSDADAAQAVLPLPSARDSTRIAAFRPISTSRRLVPGRWPRSERAPRASSWRRPPD